MVIFEIMGVRKSDEGKYCCIAKNKLGKDEASFELKHFKSRNTLAPKFTTQLKVGIGFLRQRVNASLAGCSGP